MKLRHASASEAEKIFHALLKLLSASKAAQMKHAEPLAAYRALYAARDAGRLYVYGDYAILVDVGSPWYTHRPFLIEEIIIRFRSGDGNSVESAVEQLEVIAGQHGCVAIAAGDTQIGIMAPRYIAAGYQVLGTQFYKEGKPRWASLEN